MESKLNCSLERIESKNVGWLLVKNIERIEVKNTVRLQLQYARFGFWRVEVANERIFTKYNHDTNVFSRVCIVIVSC